MYSLGIVLWELFTLAGSEMERVVGINKLWDSVETISEQWPDIGALVWRLTSGESGEWPGACELPENTFSDKDLSMVERDREVEVLRGTLRLQQARAAGRSAERGDRDTQAAALQNQTIGR